MEIALVKPFNYSCAIMYLTQGGKCELLYCMSLELFRSDLFKNQSTE